MGFESPPVELAAGRRALFGQDSDRAAERSSRTAQTDDGFDRHGRSAARRDDSDGSDREASDQAEWSDTDHAYDDDRRFGSPVAERRGRIDDGGASREVDHGRSYDDEDDSEGGAFRWILFGLLLLSVVFMVLGIQRITRSGSSESMSNDVVAEGDRGQEPGLGVDQSRTEVVDGQVDEDGEATSRFVAPLEIFPQRARAGAPTTLLAQGSGCAVGRNGLLSIREIGTGLDGADENLVLRRGFPVDSSGIWTVRPVLAPLTPGSYRVTASCFRPSDPESGERVSSGGDGLGDLEELLARESDSRLLEASEVLVLTGPAVLPAVRLSPEQATAGADVTLAVQGSGCLSGGSVDGEVFINDGSEATRQVVRRFSGVADAAGNWTVSLPLSAAAGVPSYSVAAQCVGGTDYATGTVTFVPDEIARIGTTSATSASASALPTSPVASAITAQPTFTG